MPEHRTPPDDSALGGVLLSTLNRAAEAAPPPPPDLYRTVTRRYARRRGSLVAAAAAVTVFALLGGVIGVFELTRGGPAPVAGGRSATAEERWPDAVRTLPGTFHGRQYSVRAVLADGRVVVQTLETDGEEELGLYEPEGAGWIARTLVAYRKATPGGDIMDVTANGKWLVWRLSRGTSPGQIWGLRWDDEVPRRITEAARPLGTFSLTLSGDRVILGPTSEGIRSVSLTDGVWIEYDETAKYYYVYWPWLILNPSSPHHPKGAKPELWNIETNERVTAAFTPTRWSDTCSPVWCLATGKDGDRVVTVRVDGTDRRSWPAHRTNHVSLTPMNDRYLPLYRAAPAADDGVILDLVDVVNGRTVELGRLPSSTVLPGDFDTGEDFVAWPADDGKQRKVLDLRKIP